MGHVSLVAFRELEPSLTSRTHFHKLMWKWVQHMRLLATLHMICYSQLLTEQKNPKLAQGNCWQL